MAPSIIVRAAGPTEIEALVSFTLHEARAAEGWLLDEVAVRRGVEAAFRDPPRARYWVAEVGAALAGSVSVVTEWSNFHGGDYWWVQSLFVAPGHRGTGIVDRLLDHVTVAARAAGALDLRLYAHRDNAGALRACRRLGFEEAPWVIMRRPLR